MPDPVLNSTEQAPHVELEILITMYSFSFKCGAYSDHCDQIEYYHSPIKY